jgi:molybdopterin synthase sulfur carrier subunit
MGITVRIAGPLRQLTEGSVDIDIEAEDVSRCLDQLGGRFPKLKERLWDENGQIQRYINVYVNGDDIRFLKQLSTPLGAGDEVSIIPAVAGG